MPITLRITKLPLSPVPPGNITCTVGHKRSNTHIWTIDSNNVVVQPNGVLVTPFDIFLGTGFEWDIMAKSNCGTFTKIERIFALAGGETTTTTTIAPTTTTTTSPPMGTTTTNPIPPPTEGTVCVDFNWGGGGSVTIQHNGAPGTRYTIRAGESMSCRSDIPFGEYIVDSVEANCPSPLKCERWTNQFLYRPGLQAVP